MGLCISMETIERISRVRRGRGCPNTAISVSPASKMLIVALKKRVGHRKCNNCIRNGARNADAGPRAICHTIAQHSALEGVMPTADGESAV